MSASPDRDPETVELFVEESLEALQRMEKNLLAAEAGKAPKDLMAVLFRDIHTLKGSAGFLAYDRSRRLAHAAEDLLAKLRDGAIVATPAHFALLMSSGDGLRNLLESIKATGEETEFDVEGLVAQLRVAESQSAAAAALLNTVASSTIESTQAVSSAAPQNSPVAATSNDVVDAADEGSTRGVETADGTVRVNVGVLDRLMNLIGELVLARNQMVQMVRSMSDATTHSQAACQRLSIVTSDLQEQVMKTRMQPVGRVFEKIPRMVRDLCNATGKQVTTKVDGTATEIDKALVEAIRDPVMHIVRNAIDHGIETPEVRLRSGKSVSGRLRVSASHEGGTVIIEIADDGRGMDPKALRAHAVAKGVITEAAAERLTDREALELVFRPGFSTAKAVTDISGRGVGMDVVRTHVERAGGQVELDSIAGKGTTIRLKMPLTLAIIPALLVKSGAQRFAIPQVNLLELVYLDEEQAKTAIENVRGALIYRLRGEVLPLVHLHEVLKCPPRADNANGISIVVVAVGSRRYGLMVDQIHDTEEIVIKPLQGALKRLSCYAGATVLGDGGVALILEVAGVAAMAGIDSTTRRAADSPPAQGTRHGGPQPYIVFVAGDGAQCAVPLAMVSRLEQLPTNSIERVAGKEVVQYRNQIMPIVRPENMLDIGQSLERLAEQPLIVFDFGQTISMAVNRILDVVEVDMDSVHRQNDGEYVLGKTVIGGATTLIVDVYSMVRAAAPEFVRERRKQLRMPHILLMDSSNAMRAGLAGYLRANGVQVSDFATGESVLAELKAHGVTRFDAAIIDCDVDDIQTISALDVLRYLHQEAPAMPKLVWTFEVDSPQVEQAQAAGALACINKLNREELLDHLYQTGVLHKRRQNDDAVTGRVTKNDAPRQDRSAA